VLDASIDFRGVRELKNIRCALLMAGLSADGTKYMQARLRRPPFFMQNFLRLPLRASDHAKRLMRSRRRMLAFDATADIAIRVRHVSECRSADMPPHQQPECAVCDASKRNPAG
jgi:hypothetical protein